MRSSISAVASAIVILMCSFVVVPQKSINHGGKIETKYDGFALETVMKLRRMKVSCDGFKDNFKEGCASIEVALHCPGTQVSHVGKVTLQLVFETADWHQSHAPNQRDLSILVDSETIRLGRMSLMVSEASEWGEKKVETLAATIPYDVFKKVVASQSVEIKVGPSTVSLRDKNLLALRDLDSRIIATK
jgi:hypothetical protein